MQTANQVQPVGATAVGVAILASFGAFLGRRTIKRLAFRVAAAAVSFPAAYPVTTAVIAAAGTTYAVAEGGSFLLNQYYAHCNQAELAAINAQLEAIIKQNAALTLQVKQNFVSVAQMQQQKLQLTAALNALEKRIIQLNTQSEALHQQSVALQANIVLLQQTIQALEQLQAQPVPMPRAA